MYKHQKKVKFDRQYTIFLTVYAKIIFNSTAYLQDLCFTFTMEAYIGNCPAEHKYTRDIILPRIPRNTDHKTVTQNMIYM